MSNPYFVPRVEEKKEKSTEVKAKKFNCDSELACEIGADLLKAALLIGGSFIIGYHTGVTSTVAALFKESAKLAATS